MTAARDAGAHRRTVSRLLASACLALAGAAVQANGDTGPAGALFGTQLSGQTFQYTVRTGDTLHSISARHGEGSVAIARANALDPRQALRPGQVLELDNRHVVPADADGILVNIPQRMLFHFEDGSLRAAWPITAGGPGWRTPRGPFTVINRQTDKPWIVPKSIQAEMLREGKPVLTRVEPGPENPLGRHWIGVSIPGIGIHGTNAPSSIYALRSHGCIRMHPDDVAALFGRVEVGSPGRFVYHPALLAALADGRVFVEVHRDAYRLAREPLAALRELAEARGVADRIDWTRAAEIVAARDGIAREVTLSEHTSAERAPAPANQSPGVTDR